MEWEKTEKEGKTEEDRDPGMSAPDIQFVCHFGHLLNSA